MSRFGYTVLGFGGFTSAGGPGVWTDAGQTINTNRYQCVTAGSSASAIIAGGSSTGNSEVWNGNSWSNAADNLATSPVNSAQGGGTASSAIVIGGNRGGSASQVCEIWNSGSGTWASGPDNTNSVFTVGASAADSSTSAWVCGGYTGSAVGDKTNSLSGTTWSNKEDLPTGRLAMAANNTGSASDAAAMTGSTGSLSAKNERWTDDTWATDGADITTALTDSPAGFGQTSGGDVIVSHGENASGPSGDCFEFTNGSWTTGNTCLANIRNNYGGGPTGTGITCGGYNETAGAYVDYTYTFARAIST